MNFYPMSGEILLWWAVYLVGSAICFSIGLYYTRYISSVKAKAIIRAIGFALLFTPYVMLLGHDTEATATESLYHAVPAVAAVALGVILEGGKTALSPMIWLIGGVGIAVTLNLLRVTRPQD